MAIYLDHNATTFPSEKALQAFTDFQAWGNPSSIHASGRKARMALTAARRQIASTFKCAPGELIFTSGGSESNNLAISGMLAQLKKENRKVILSTTAEHPSVFKKLETLEEEGFKVIRLKVNKDGLFEWEKFINIIESEPVGLVSSMWANNETGVITDIHKMGDLLKPHKIWFHSDMVQTLGKLEVNLKELPVHLASFSAHKFYSLKGVGCLFQRKGTPLKAFLKGGGQERGRRAGTENPAGVFAFSKQIQELSNLEDRVKYMSDLRMDLEAKLIARISDLKIVASGSKRLPNTSMIMIDRIHGETLLMNLDIEGFEVSTGAACSSGNPEPSPVLLSMGYTPEEASSSLRLSIGWNTSKAEIEAFVDILEKVVIRLRSLYGKDRFEQEA